MSKKIKKPYYPFSAKLIKGLKELGVYEKAMNEYDSLTDKDRAIRGKEDSIDCCFIFTSTRDGFDFWWDINNKLS